jgi:hypothetical protein
MSQFNEYCLFVVIGDHLMVAFDFINFLFKLDKLLNIEAIMINQR